MYRPHCFSLLREWEILTIVMNISPVVATLIADKKYENVALLSFSLAANTESFSVLLSCSGLPLDFKLLANSYL